MAQTAKGREGIFSWYFPVISTGLKHRDMVWGPTAGLSQERIGDERSHRQKQNNLYTPVAVSDK